MNRVISFNSQDKKNLFNTVICTITQLNSKGINNSHFLVFTSIKNLNSLFNNHSTEYAKYRYSLRKNQIWFSSLKYENKSLQTVF